MGIADRLFAIAEEIASQYQGRASSLQREIFELETQLKEKKAALDLAGMASKRASNFVPMRGADFYCPSCWITAEQNAPLHPIPNDIMRCNICGGGFEV
jgi:hypothetical protein